MCVQYKVVHLSSDNMNKTFFPLLGGIKFSTKTPDKIKPNFMQLVAIYSLLFLYMNIIFI